MKVQRTTPSIYDATLNVLLLPVFGDINKTVRGKIREKSVNLKMG